MWYLKRRGSDVVLAENLPIRAAGRIIAALWLAEKVPIGIASPIADRDRAPAEFP
jgi:hypothetical protein